MAYDPELERKFGDLVKDAKSSPSQQVAAAENILKDSSMTAAAEVVNLLNNGDRETTRLAAAKYILDRVLPKPDYVPPGDPLTAFLNQVKSNASN